MANMLRWIVILGLGAVADVGSWGFASAAAQAEPAASSSGSTPTAFEGIPNVEVRYYDVTGRSAAAIRAAMNAIRPTDRNDGTGTDAHTDTSISWSWPPGRGGACNVTEASVTFSAVVTLPRLMNTENVPDRVLEAWRRFTAALEAHEAMHVRIAYEGSKAALLAIQAADCATANRAANDALDEINRKNIELDRTTRHGETDGVRFP